MEVAVKKILRILYVLYGYLLRAALVTFLSVQAVHANESAEPISPIKRPVGLNMDIVQLGKQLFHDTRLSINESVSCASCHSMSMAGTDNLEKSLGIDGKLTLRNTPSVWNSGSNIAQFWDGRAATLAEQIHAVMSNPAEMGDDWEGAIKRLSADKVFYEQMAEHYEPPVTQSSITDAIENYLEALVSLGSPFDAYLMGNRDAISEEAQQGYALFKEFGCVSCHQGANVGGNLFQTSGLKIGPERRALWIAEAEGENKPKIDLGRYEFTGREKDRYIFRVPSLRNVANTAPYMHHGQVGTLELAIRIMAAGQLGRQIDDSQVAQIQAFLSTLSGDIDEDLK